MLLRSFWTFLTRLIAPGETLDARVRRVFPPEDREIAKEFYESWSVQEYLPIQVGEGEGVTSISLIDAPEQFYGAASFFFYAEPIDRGDHWIIAWDSEDDMSGISLDKASGKVFRILGDEQDTTWTLATSFGDFLTRLRRANCCCPGSSIFRNRVEDDREDGSLCQ